MRKWFRLSDFYVFMGGHPASTLKQSASFHNLAIEVCILEIMLLRYTDACVLNITPHPFFFQEIKNICQQFACFVKASDYSVATNTIKLKFYSKQDIKQTFLLFNAINQKYRKDELPAELVQELNDIALVILNKPSAKRKLLPDYKAPSDLKYGDPLPPLVDLFKKNNVHLFGVKKDLPFKEYKRLLASGASPNQRDNRGSSILYWLTPMENTLDELTAEIIKLALFYGADPSDRNHGFGDLHLSVVEKAKLYNNMLLLNLILVACSHYQSSPKAIFPLSIDIYSHKNALKTLFVYPHSRFIQTRLSKLSELTPKEWDAVKARFNKTFKTQPGEFEEDFCGDDKLIELIHIDHHLIGFVLFQKIKLEDNSITINCLYIDIEKEFRYSGLANLLCQRLTFAMQLLEPSQILAHFFSAVNIHSFMMVNQPNLRYLQFPMINPACRQDAQAVPIPIEEIVKKIYKEYVFYCHAMTAYVLDGCKTTSEKKNAHKLLTYDMFYNYILGYGEKSSEKEQLTRAATILYYIGNENFLMLSSFMQNNMGIDIFRHLYQFAKHLTPFVQEVYANPCLSHPVKAPVFSNNWVLHNERKKEYVSQNITIPCSM